MNRSIRPEIRQTEHWEERLESLKEMIPLVLATLEKRPSNLCSFAKGFEAALIADGLGFNPDRVMPF